MSKIMNHFTKSQALRINLLCTVMLVGMLSPAIADSSAELKKAADAACKNIKMCIKKQISSEENVPPQMLEMIDNLANQACESLYEVQNATDVKSLIEPITDCYNEMANTSCEDLENGHQPKICADLEKTIEQM